MGMGPGAKFHISNMNNPKHRIRATIKTDLRLAQNRKREATVCVFLLQLNPLTFVSSAEIYKRMGV